MTTPNQIKIDQGRQRTLDAQIASRWWGSVPSTTRNTHTGEQRTTFERASRATLDAIQSFIEAYNAGMDDARGLIAAPVVLGPIVDPTERKLAPTRQGVMREATALANQMELLLLEVANGVRPADWIPMEPMVRAVRVLRELVQELEGKP